MWKNCLHVLGILFILLSIIRIYARIALNYWGICMLESFVTLQLFSNHFK